MRRILPFILCLVLFVSIPACTGVKARDHAAVPVLVDTSTGIQADVEIGLALLPQPELEQTKYEAALFFHAIHSGDREAIATEALPRWDMIRNIAENGIAARVQEGTIGPNVAESLRERLTRFDETLRSTADRLR